MPRVLAALVLALLLFVALPVPAAAAGGVSGFYVGWMSSTYPPSAVDYASLSQVMVFSVIPHADGTLDTTLFIDSVNGPAVAKDLAQRAHAAGKKALLVVGGAGASGGFASACSSSTRPTFVQNLMQTATSWGMDGFDIDWEPLTSTDYAGMLALVNDLRAAWPAAILTADLGWGLPTGATDNQFYVQLSNTLDQINLMTYGMADAWPGWVSWHGSAIFGDGADHPSSVNRYVTAMLNAGVPPAKLSMGIGFYGSCWNPPVTAPLQSPNGSHVVADDNTMSFANIMNTYYSASAYRYDATAEAPYLSFPSATGPQGCTFVSYENEASVAAKGSYAQQKGLGGTIIWQINEGYDPSAADPHSLLHAVAAAFGSSQPAAPTSTAVGSSSPTSTFGQSVTFTATVTSGSGVPTGSVSFRDGATALGSATLANGGASFTTSALGAGAHSITAAYAGASGFAASTSAAASQVVNQASTTTSLTSSRNPTKRRQTVTFTARVSAVAPGAGTPTGTVRFFDGAVQIGSASLASGSASLSTSGLASGSHTITAAYDGSTSYKPSTSTALTQTIK